MSQDQQKFGGVKEQGPSGGGELGKLPWAKGKNTEHQLWRKFINSAHSGEKKVWEATLSVDSKKCAAVPQHGLLPSVEHHSWGLLVLLTKYQ